MTLTRFSLLTALLLVSACRKTDFTEAPVPEAGTVLLLRTVTTGDTARVALSLEGAVALSIGSVTGEVEHAPGWTFVGCDAASPNAEGMVACKAHSGTVRVAGAWAAGTNLGALVQLRFVRAAGVSSETWALSVREMHTARGEPVREGEISVRREGVR